MNQHLKGLDNAYNFYFFVDLINRTAFGPEMLTVLMISVNGIKPSCLSISCLTVLGEEISASSRKCQFKNAMALTLYLMWGKKTGIILCG